MEFVWLLLILTTMVVYLVVLIRSARKGKRWARETLEAMCHLGGDVTMSTWRPLPREPEPEPPAEAGQEEARRQGPGQLVA